MSAAEWRRLPGGAYVPTLGPRALAVALEALARVYAAPLERGAVGLQGCARPNDPACPQRGRAAV